MANGNNGQQVLTWILIILAAGFGADYFGLTNFGNDGGGNQGGNDGTPVKVEVTGQTCADSSTITLGSLRDKYTPTTSYTGDFHKLFLNGADKGLYADGATLTASPSDKIQIWTAFNATSEYSAHESFEVGCSGSYTAGALPEGYAVSSDSRVKASLNGAKAFEAIQNGTAAETVLTFYNDDGQPQSSGSNALSLTVNQEKCVNFKVQAPANKGVSPHGKAMLVLDSNKTTISSIRSGSADLVTGSVPVGHTEIGPIGMGSSGDVISQGLEFGGLESNGQYIGTVCVKGDATTEPTTFSNISASLKDQDWYQDSTTAGLAGMKFGYETNTHVDVGGADATGYLYIS